MSIDPYRLASGIGFFFILCIFAALYGYFVVLKRRNMPEAMTHHDFEELRAAGTPFTLVDVREPSEFKTSPREGAVNIPVGHIAYDTADWDRQGLYVLVCAKGIRAKKGALEMASRGFRNVRYLKG